MIEYPWPDSGLRPNARLHFHAKAKITKLARESAYWITKKADIPQIPPTGEIMLDVTFHAPDKRRRDCDGQFSSCKAIFDGLADALEVDDYRFAFTIRRGEPVKSGSVEIVIITSE